MTQLFKVFCSGMALFAVISCNRDSTKSAAAHALVGAWQAEDKTVFLFRNDHSFHGIDFVGREIWGTWVELSDSRIGFQSLSYDSSYRPQYAIIRTEDSNQMDYINTGNISFTAAKRIEPEKAQIFIEMTATPMLHRPKKENTE
jgi:hypothetical protein